MLAGPQAGQGDGQALDIDSLGHHAVANVGGPVGAEGVGQVVTQGGNGACATVVAARQREGARGQEVALCELLQVHAWKMPLPFAKGCLCCTYPCRWLVPAG